MASESGFNNNPKKGLRRIRAHQDLVAKKEKSDSLTPTKFPDKEKKMGKKICEGREGREEMGGKNRAEAQCSTTRKQNCLISS